MRVVHVFKDYYPPTTGGIEQHMRLLCTALASDADICVLVPSRSRRTTGERIDGVRVIRVAEFGRYGSAPLCPMMPLTLRRLAPDLVHLHFPNPMGDVTYLLSAVHAPLVLTYHADIIKQRRWLPLYEPVLAKLFTRVHRIIAASTEYVDSSEFLSRYRHKCTIVPYGVDSSALALENGEAEAVRKLKNGSDSPLIVFLGAFRYYKGVDVLLRAMTLVQARVCIVGRGTEQADLRRQASRLGIADRVEFRGEVSDADRRIVLHAADVFVLPSIDRCEAFGIVQLEAMACGKPVVASDLPTGVRFVNQHEVTGLLVPPGDVDALAGALNRLIHDPALRARFGAAGRQRAAVEFTVARMVSGIRQVYEDVLSGGAVA